MLLFGDAYIQLELHYGLCRPLSGIALASDLVDFCLYFNRLSILVSRIPKVTYISYPNSLLAITKNSCSILLRTDKAATSGIVLGECGG